MSTNLYNEAIVEAKKLREVAENNAKNAILEAVTPKLKSMIDNLILNEAEEDLTEEDVLLSVAGKLADASNDKDLAATIQQNLSSEDDAGDYEIDYDAFSQKDKNIGSISSDNYPRDFGGTPETEGQLVMTAESLDNLIKISGKNIENLNEFSQRLESLETAKRVAESILAENINSAGEIKTFLITLTSKMLTEVNTLSKYMIRIDESYQKDISSTIQKTHEEIVGMSKRILETYESMGEDDMIELSEEEEDELLLDEPEGDVEEEEDDEEMELDLEDDDEEAEEGVDMDAARDALTALADALGVDMDEADEDEEEVELDLEDEEEEEDDEEEEVEESYRMVEEEEEEEDGDDEVVEIDESMLRRELSRMMSSLNEADGAEFGGGKEGKEPFVDMTDKDINAHDKTLKEARTNRVLRNKLAEYRDTVRELQQQLEESHLFSSKLLYMNKLLQTRELTDNQKKVVVESLNKAETLREVRLLHKSFEDTLSGNRKASLTESKRRKAGSSSRTVRSASTPKTLNESAGGFESSRWEILAGISDDS